MEGEDRGVNLRKQEGHVFLIDMIKGKDKEGKSREALRWRRRQEGSSCKVVFSLSKVRN